MDDGVSTSASSSPQPQRGRSRSPSDADGATNLLSVAEAASSRVPEVPRLAVLDAADAEWSRWRAEADPLLVPLVLPATVWRLRSGEDPLEP